jgi:hypothetical protein
MWGAHFFLVVLEREPPVPRVFSSRSRIPYPDSGLVAESVLVDLAHSSSPARQDVVLENYGVSIKGRSPCRLGNTQRYKLLEILWEECGKFVSLEEIADQMERGEQDSLDGIKVVKCRLMKDLSSGGYLDLAKCIKSESNNYGLFLRE